MRLLLAAAWQPALLQRSAAAEQMLTPHEALLHWLSPLVPWLDSAPLQCCRSRPLQCLPDAPMPLQLI